MKQGRSTNRADGGSANVPKQEHFQPAAGRLSGERLRVLSASFVPIGADHEAMKPVSRFLPARVGLIALVLLALQGEVFAMRIGVLLKSRGVVWNKTEQGITETAQALGVELVLKQVPDSANPQLQVMLLEAILKENLDALIIAPIDPPRLEAILRPFVQKGLKVVSIDLAMGPEFSKVLVTNNQEVMAEQAARLAAGLVKNGDEVAVLRFQQTDQAVLGRERKIISTLKERLPRSTIRADVFAATSFGNLSDQASNFLGKYPDAKLVITTAFGATREVMRLLRDQGLGEKTSLVGFGMYLPEEMASAVEAGVIDGWIAQKPKDLGIRSVELTVALLKGQ